MQDQKYGLGETSFSPQELDEMMSPELAQKKARQNQFNENLGRLLAGDGEDNAGSYKLRCIVEQAEWFVPVKADQSKSDHCWSILNTQKGEYERLIAGINKADGRRTERLGQGGQMLPVYSSKPDDGGHYRVLDGRTLVRTLPSGISALLIQLQPSDPLRELDKSYFEELKKLAAAVDLESILLENANVDSSRLLEQNFVAAFLKQDLCQNSGVASVGTHPESLHVRDEEITIKPIPAERVFKEVFDDENFCGILVNPLHEIGSFGKGLKGLYLSPNFIYRTISGIDGPVRVERYLARSREEFELFLEQTNFPTPYQIIEGRDSQGKSTIEAVSMQPGANWSIFECDSILAADEVRTPCFELALAPGCEQELANGKSYILCPALMAQKLYGQLLERDRKANRWSPGKSFGFGRSLSDADIAASRLRLKLASEILKLIPPGIDAIARQSILTVAGAKFLSWAAFAGKRSWLEETREQAKKFDKKFVLGA